MRQSVMLSRFPARGAGNYRIRLARQWETLRSGSCCLIQARAIFICAPAHIG